jgi:carbon monoxide dehydrogenase subunit G
MIRFEGDRQLPYAPAETFSRLRDARFLVQCIQGAQPAGEEASADQAQCRVQPNLPFVRGSMEVTLRVVEAAEPSLLRVQVLGQGNNLTSVVDTILELSEQQAGTRVHWVAEVKKLGGVLNVVPQSQVQTAAQKVIQEVWSLLSSRMSKPAAKA